MAKNVIEIKGKKKLTREEREKIDNKVVLITAVILITALVLAYMYRFHMSSHVLTIRSIYTGLAIAGGAAIIVFAVLTFIKKNKWFLNFAAIGAAVAAGSLAINRFGVTGYIGVYIAMAAYLIGSIIYYYFKLRRKR